MISYTFQNSYIRIVVCFTIFLLSGYNLAQAADLIIDSDIVPVVQSSHTSGSSDTTEPHASPVDFRVTLAGNFGEIRSNHFHSGIDIKALNGIGSPIRATADGYISRIGVSPTGYGRAIYITHPERGEMTVYAHLNSFAPRIQKWVESEQIRLESFKVDLYPPASMFPVTQGDQIATLGNSGSSAGPHLHYEVRKLASHNPINPLSRLAIRVPDHVKPTIATVLLYEIDTLQNIPHITLKQSIKLQTSQDGKVTIAPGQDSVLKITKPSYIAYQVIDHKDGKTNTMGISSITQKIDTTVNFAFELDHINFKTTRYINSFTQYDKNKETSKYDVIRAYVSPNNQLNIYTTLRNRGIITPESIAYGDDELSHLNTTIRDEQGNSTELTIPIKRANNNNNNNLTDSNQTTLLDSTTYAAIWNKDFTYKSDRHTIKIDPRSFYESTMIDITPNQGDNSIKIAPLSTTAPPLHKAATLEFINPSNVPAGYESKAIVVSIDRNGKIRSAGGQMNDQERILRTSFNNFGHYGIALDTIAPSITLKEVGQTNKLTFIIKDNLSGIAKYRLTINGKWVIAEYDPRKSSLTYEFIRSVNPSSHKVRLEVSDATKNLTTLEKQIKW